MEMYGVSWKDMGWSDADVERVMFTTSEFNLEVLRYADECAKRDGIEELTDECGIALMVGLACSAVVDKVARHDGLTEDAVAAMSVYLDHIEGDHPEYSPYIKEAVATPRCIHYLDQIRSATRDVFDYVKGVNKEED